MNNIEFEFRDDISLDEIDLGRNQWHKIIKEWERTENKTCVFKLKNLEERRKCVTSLRNYCKAHNKDYTVYLGKNKLTVYLIRA